MRNEEKKRMGSGGRERGKWQENVRFYIHTAIMYNKLYTYVHEIFLSTTIITFNYNYSWNFFYSNAGKERIEGERMIENWKYLMETAEI